MLILIVDDSKAMRMIILRTLKQAGLSGFKTLEAGNGQEALEIVSTQNPDLIISDWNMPEMKGIELLQKLREAGRSTRFGFVTSESGQAVREEALNAGAAFVIIKPFTPQTFETALKPLLAGCC
ncbi:response regulator [Planctomicrobium sp. SH664]|uniref:response regulator n=1 Tax=Planctomicrobium sp. SH664 TaxID=3448125 RepID=UPI003F5AFC86